MSLPNPVSDDWNGNVLGGSSNDPCVLHLVEENLMTNGDFEETLSGWDNEAGVAPSRVDLGVDAPNGNYVMKLLSGAITHRSVAFDGTKILFTGKLRFLTACAGQHCNITLYITNDTNYVANPVAKFVKLAVESVDTNVDATDYFMGFFVELECVAGKYVHINLESEAGVDTYFDDFMLYEVNEAVSLYEPNKMSLGYKYYKDAEYELFDGTKKTYAKGWRPTYKVVYDFVDAEGMQKVVRLSEHMFNFFVPHSNNLCGSYVRFVNDLSYNPFQNKFLGHSVDLELEGIFLQKFKMREYGESYFSVTSG